MQQWNSENRMNCLQSIFLAINGEEGSSPPPSVGGVDCTLSLGTPATRQHSAKTNAQLAPANYSLRLDLLPSPASASRLAGDELLLPRRCANCDTTSTPLWRNGPRGPKSLCNACGIRYKKEERRAASSTMTTLTSSSPSSSSSSSVPSAEQQQQYLPANYAYRQTWGCPQMHRFNVRFQD